MAKLTQERLKELMYYDPETGIFTWKVNRGRNATAGNIAGTKDKDGYIIIHIDKKAHKSHRLAWLYMKGYFPNGIEIDHIDQDKANNNWDNLRIMSHACNMKNTGNYKNNSSGVKGVSWNNRSKKWSVHIQTNKNRKHIGRFETLDDAICCRLAAEQCLNWNTCEPNSPAVKYVKKYINSKIK